MQSIKIGKELGSGGNGTAYLATVDGEKLVYKIVRLDVYDIYYENFKNYAIYADCILLNIPF